MIDLVIPLSNSPIKRSIWDENEVRYSIRSFVKYFKDLGKIIIIGAKPEFLDWSNPRLIHIPFQDQVGNKDYNMVSKVFEACNLENLTETFIRGSDDQLILKEVDIVDFRPLYSEELYGVLRGNMWKRRLNETYCKLKDVGKEHVYNFDCHYPTLYDKNLFRLFVNQFPFKDQGYTINTMYFNATLSYFFKMPENYKIQLRSPIYSFAEIDNSSEDVKFLGYNNKALRTGMLKEFIQFTFKSKTEFEL